MAKSILSSSELDHYERDGYVLVPKLFDDQEMSVLLDFARGDQDL